MAPIFCRRDATNDCTPCILLLLMFVGDKSPNLQQHHPPDKRRSNVNLAASRLTWFQLTKAPFVGPKIVFTMLPVDVRLLIDPPHPITRYSSSIMIHACRQFYFYLLQASFQCFQADEEDEWPLSSVQAPWGVDIPTKMVGSQTNLWLTSKILKMSS